MECMRQTPAGRFSYGETAGRSGWEADGRKAELTLVSRRAQLAFFIFFVFRRTLGHQRGGQKLFPALSEGAFQNHFGAGLEENVTNGREHKLYIVLFRTTLLAVHGVHF